MSGFMCYTRLKRRTNVRFFAKKLAVGSCKIGNWWHNMRVAEARVECEKRKKSEVSFLENYVKVVLYVYPLLKTIGKDYEEHIKNKALLSYKATRTEDLAIYLAEEILAKEKLEWLKDAVDEVLGKLSDVERTLIAIRYFGKRRKVRTFLRLKERNERGLNEWSEREYFRKQKRLSDKVGAMLAVSGLTKEKYEKEFSKMELFEKVDKFVAEGRDKKITQDERRWLCK